MSTIITHKGRVKQIDNTRIQVQIMQASACSACEAKSLCHSAESKEKMIEVHTADAADFKVGQEVMLVGTLSLALVWWASKRYAPSRKDSRPWFMPMLFP